MTRKFINKSIALMLSVLMMLSLFNIGATTFFAEESTKVYFVNTQNWSSVYCYVWNEAGESLSGAWPGETAEIVDNLNGVYSYDAGDGDYMFFNNGSNEAETTTLNVSDAVGKYYEFSTNSFYNTVEEARIAGGVEFFSADSVKVTLKSKQNLFEDITQAYRKGDTFEMTVMWQSDYLVSNGQFYTDLNSQGLKVISAEFNSKLSSIVTNNISEEVQQNYGYVTFNFSSIKGLDYSVSDILVKYQIQVLETASKEETLTLNCFEILGIPAKYAEGTYYVQKEIVNQDVIDQFSLTGVLSEGVPEVIETEPASTTESATATEFTTESVQDSSSTASTEESTLNTESTESVNTESSTAVSEPTATATEDTQPSQGETESVEVVTTAPATDSAKPTETEATSTEESTQPSEVATDSTEPSSTETEKPTDSTETILPTEDCSTQGTETNPTDSVSGTDSEPTTEPTTETTEPTEHSHQWESGVVTKEPSCTENGEMTYSCTGCQETKTEVIDAKGHETTVTGAKKATYFAKGHTGDTVCRVCGETIEKGKSISKLKLKTPTVKITGGKKKITVKYTKVQGANGFQVKYKVGKKTVTKTYTAKKNATKVIKKLKKGTYKVQVRAFVKQGSKKAYSKWTKVKKVKVK